MSQNAIDVILIVLSVYLLSLAYLLFWERYTKRQKLSPKDKREDEKLQELRALLKKLKKDHAEYQQKLRNIDEMHSQASKDLFCNYIAQGIDQVVAKERAVDLAEYLVEDIANNLMPILDSLEQHIEEVENEIKEIYS